MMTGKFLTPVPKEMFNWVKETAQATGTNHSDVVRGAIALAMQSKEFKATLVNTQLKIQLATLDAKRAALDAQERDTRKRAKDSGLVLEG